MENRFYPGSFTKNIGAGRSIDSGLLTIHNQINVGFQDAVEDIERKVFRESVDSSTDLVPLNFFLFNYISNKQSFLLADELVFHALSKGPLSLFNYLALFSLTLGESGEWINNRKEKSENWISFLIKEKLWENGQWVSERLKPSYIDKELKKILIVKTNDTIVKCRNNFLFIFHKVFPLVSDLAYVDTKYEKWMGSAFFLVWDRYLATHNKDTFSHAEAKQVLIINEIHKLLGCSQSDLDYYDYYLKYKELGFLKRFKALTTSKTLKKTVTKSKKVQSSTEGKTKLFTDLQIRSTPVEKQLKTYLLLKRDRKLASDIKSIYKHRCLFCNKRLIVDVSPDNYYSEAAHIRAVSEEGFDSRDNIIVVCPLHHIQFDRGVISIAYNQFDKLIAISKIPDDPIHGKNLILHSDHKINKNFVKWHNENIFKR